MKFRTATADDAVLLASMNRRLIEDEGSRNALTPADLETRMRGWLNKEYKAVLFEEGGEICAYALYRDMDDGVYLRQFFVRPDRRRKGMGRVCIKQLVDEVLAGTVKVTLDVLAGNPDGYAFWRAVGFSDYATMMEWNRRP